MKKSKKILIVLAITLAIIASIIVLCTILLSNAILIRMPSSYICKQLEKDVPIGTSADDVIGYVEANGVWTNAGYAGDPDDPNEFILYDGGVSYKTGVQRDPENSYSFYSFSNIDYENTPTTEYGSYNLYVELGDIPWKDTNYLFGRGVRAYFVFDEEQNLIDIVVCKEFFGP